MTRTLLCAVLLAVSVPAAAPAQEMPDPRQMSGIPRPDEAVKPQTVTVRVIHGEFGKPAGLGQLVHLVAIKPDGSVEKMTKPVREDGRAEFPGLATGGTIAYYAFTILDADRLESDNIFLPPMVGVRLMLVGRKLDAAGAPIGDPVDDQQAQADPNQKPLPAGEIEVAVRSASDDPVELLEIGNATPVATTRPTGDVANADLRAAFKGVATGRDKVYVVRMRHGARTFLSRPFMMSETAGARPYIIALGQVLFGFHMGGELDDDRFVFEARYALGNLTGVPYDPGPKGLFLPLPDGFMAARIEEEELAQKIKVIPGEGVYWNGIVPPGQRDFTVQWAMEVHGGAVDFRLPAPLGIFQGQVILEHFPGSTVTPPPGVSPRLSRLDTGREFYVLGGVSTPAGATFEFTIEGLPQHPRSAFWVKLLISLLVMGLLVWTMVVAIRSAPVSEAKSADVAVRRRELVNRRERLYDQLVHLEKQRAADRIDGGRFQRERADLIAKLSIVHRELDELDAGAAGPTAGAR